MPSKFALDADGQAQRPYEKAPVEASSNKQASAAGSKSGKSKSSAATKVSATAINKTKRPAVQVTVQLRVEQAGHPALKKSFGDRGVTLRSAVQQMLGSKGSSVTVQQVEAVQVRFPNPRRTISWESPDMDK